MLKGNWLKQLIQTAWVEWCNFQDFSTFLAKATAIIVKCVVT